MTYLRKHPRQIKTADSLSAIHRVLDRYVDLRDLRLRNGFGAKKVEYLEQTDDSTLVLRFDGLLESDRAEIYTVVNDRFIDFELETIGPADPKYPPYSYVMRIRRCAIALDKREHERTYFTGERPRVTNITTIKVREKTADFLKSLSVRMIVEEFVGKISGGDFRKIMFADERDLPPHARYVLMSGEEFRIHDSSDPGAFFREHDTFSAGPKAGDLGEDLAGWIRATAPTAQAVVAKPITYSPLVGEPFTIGVLSVMKRQGDFTESEIGEIARLLDDISEKIRNGNLVDSRAEGRIMDVSAGGARIDLADGRIVEKMLSQNVLVFEMNFREGNPLLISGTIVYVYRRDDGGFYLGVDYRGSRFGPRIVNVLPNHVRHFLHQHSH